MKLGDTNSQAEAPYIQTGAFVGTTNASGLFTITFPVPFASLGYVTCQPNTTYAVVCLRASADASGATFGLYQAVTGAPLANTAIAISWLAIGARQ